MCQRSWRLGLTELAVMVTVLWALAAPASAQGKPNIVVIWGDDIGM